MENSIETQYDDIADTFVEGTLDYNRFSRETFYSHIEKDLVGKKLLDIGCGDGFDLKQYQSKGANVYGIDASCELLKRANQGSLENRVMLGVMEKLPYADDSFDMIVSKYVIQTSKDLPKVLNEMDRVLRPGGIMVYLAVHPFRQFLEKNKHPKDYFKQEVVDSKFFEGIVSVREPSHTFNEYFNPNFLKNYELVYFEEFEDFPSVEHIEGDTFPCFFIVKAIKKN